MGQPLDGKAILLEFTPTLDTSVYADGDQLGDLATLDNAFDSDKDTGSLLSVTIVDKAKQNADLDLLFFNGEPTLVSADNAALDISDADMADKFLGRVSVAASDYSELNASSVATKLGVGLFLGAKARSEKLYVVLQSRATPTYAADSLVVKLGVIQD